MSDLISDILGTNNEDILHEARKEVQDMSSTSLSVYNTAVIIAIVKKDVGVDLLPLFESVLMKTLDQFDNRDAKMEKEANASTDFLVQMSKSKIIKNIAVCKETRQKVIGGLIETIKEIVPLIEEAIQRKDHVLD